MTDNQMAELLSLFYEIEKLMVLNGANERNLDGGLSRFKDKVRSFDTFEKEPKSPGNIGYKFYTKEDHYHIKEPYLYDANIKQELYAYVQYKLHEKRYKEYTEGILGGYYFILKKISHEYGKLLYIDAYKIENYKLFVKDCRTIIKYLSQPDKKSFLSYGKFKHLPKKKLFGRSIIGVFLKSAMLLFILIAGIFAIKYLQKQELSSFSDLNIAPYLLGAIGLMLFIYYLSHIMTLVFGMFRRRLVGLFSFLPYILGLVLIYYLLIYGRDIRERILPKIEDNKCQYFVVNVDTLHIRTAATNTSEIIDKVYKNEKLCITKKIAQWYYVYGKGWVFSEHISHAN